MKVCRSKTFLNFILLVTWKDESRIFTIPVAHNPLILRTASRSVRSLLLSCEAFIYFSTMLADSATHMGGSVFSKLESTDARTIFLRLLTYDLLRCDELIPTALRQTNKYQIQQNMSTIHTLFPHCD